jgi:hypothetical protein
LWAAKEYWKELLDPNNRGRLRAKFTPPKGDARPYARGEFSFDNTLTVHMEWKLGSKQYPYAFIQPMTGRELLIATTWIDLVKRAKFQICDRCGCSFTGKKRQYCLESCAHAAAQEKYRKRGGERKARSLRREKQKKQKSLR